MKRWIRHLAAASVLAQLLAAPAAALPYTMTIRDGFVCVVDDATGGTVCASAVPAGQLPAGDRALLEQGLPLKTRAEYTRAVEDFLS